MLLLLVLGMLEVLVVLVVLKELVVFVRGKFETVKSQNFFWGKIIESKKKFFGAKRNLIILKTKSKIHLYFGVVHSIIPLFENLHKENKIREREQCLLYTETRALQIHFVCLLPTFR